MAGDLIPPPSPAGRPEPDSSEKRARAVGRHRAGRRAPRRSPIPRRRRRSRPARRRYRPRFGFVLGALIGVALRRDRHRRRARRERRTTDGTPSGWSAWKPSADDDAGARPKQIAEHVGPKYRLGDADQLVAVDAKPLELDGRPLNVAMRTAAVGGDIELLDGKGLMYTLNGLGPNGSISGGTPSEQRHLLLRREALELALYTFRYRSDVDMVVALLPPAPPAKGKEEASATLPPVQALFYRPGDLSGELGVPLATTIPAAHGEARAGEARRARLAADRRADPLEPVHGDVPAGPGRQPLPRARPPADGLSMVGAGLCASCRHQKLIRSGRGSVFSMCLRARTDPAYPKYPPLPVTACRGHEPLRPGDDPAGPGPRGAGSPAA